jgi:hypothetical protein
MKRARAHIHKSSLIGAAGSTSAMPDGDQVLQRSETTRCANKRRQLEMKRPPTEATLMEYKPRQNRRSKNNQAHQEKRKVFFLSTQLAGLLDRSSKNCFGLSARLPVDEDRGAPTEEIHGRVQSRFRPESLGVLHEILFRRFCTKALGPSPRQYLLKPLQEKSK